MKAKTRIRAFGCKTTGIVTVVLPNNTRIYINAKNKLGDNMMVVPGRKGDDWANLLSENKSGRYELSPLNG